MLKQLWNDEFGIVLSVELVLILTIAVLAMIVGLSEIAVAVNTELNDISNGVGAMRQSFAFTGFQANSNGTKTKSVYAGTTWSDSVDDCDTNLSCELVCGASPVPTSE